MYLDPPYDYENVEDTYKYTKDMFGRKEQQQLFNVVEDLTKRGVRVMVSNHNTKFIRSLFEGYDINVVIAKRNLSKNRRDVDEVIITNYNLVDAKPLTAENSRVYSQKVVDPKKQQRLAEINRLQLATQKAMDKLDAATQKQVLPKIIAVAEMAENIVDGKGNDSESISAFVARVQDLGESIKANLVGTFNSKLLIVNKVKPTVKKQSLQKRRLLLKRPHHKQAV